MSLHDIVSAERIHIGFFGLRNAGKSSIVNAVTGQELSVVSPVKGTTTDPVKKAMELLPLGPVVMIDTPGLDDAGQLGMLRVEKARRILAQVDIAVLVVDGRYGLSQDDLSLLSQFHRRNLPCLVVWNKADLLAELPELPEGHLWVSAATGANIQQLKEALGRLSAKDLPKKMLVADLLCPGDVVLLVTPIDSSAPKGRLILPQQQTLRELLDRGCIPLTCRETELSHALSVLRRPPVLVITDSQVFRQVAEILPETQLLTSFSILFARYKGELSQLADGAEHLSHLKDNDCVLISEGCTHHRQCGDIGTEKLPQWIRRYCGCKPKFEFTSGGTFPENLSSYRLIIHCGGCMLNEKEMQYRLHSAQRAGIPIVNYGAAIAAMHGILKRSLEPFARLSPANPADRQI